MHFVFADAAVAAVAAVVVVAVNHRGAFIKSIIYFQSTVLWPP